jgi:hypothetical protein
MPNDDDKLMERIRQRHEDAFEILASRYEEALRRHLLPLTDIDSRLFVGLGPA